MPAWDRKGKIMSDYREPIVSTLFKQVSDGYVFRAPSPCVVGPARHYLVNAAQKTQIMAMLMPPRPMLRAVGLVVPLTLWPLVFTQVIVPFGFDLAHLTARDIFVMGGLFMIPFLAMLQIFHWWNLRQLRPVLADLPRTTQKISNRNLYPALVEAMPVWNLALLGFGMGMISLGIASTLASKFGRHHPVWDASSLFSVALMVLTGAFAAYLFYRHSQGDAEAAPFRCGVKTRSRGSGLGKLSSRDGSRGRSGRRNDGLWRV
jgi:hypothetical protein